MNRNWSNLYQYSQLPKEVFCNTKIFDTKICPILSHGSELWGIEKQTAIERMQTYVCKRYMCVNLKTSNDAVLDNCGRYPMYIDGIERCLSYWLKVQDHRYLRKCYRTISRVIQTESPFAESFPYKSQCQNSSNFERRKRKK